MRFILFSICFLLPFLFSGLYWGHYCHLWDDLFEHIHDRGACFPFTDVQLLSTLAIFVFLSTVMTETSRTDKNNVSSWTLLLCSTGFFSLFRRSNLFILWIFHYTQSSSLYCSIAARALKQVVCFTLSLFNSKKADNYSGSLTSPAVAQNLQRRGKHLDSIHLNNSISLFLVNHIAWILHVVKLDDAWGQQGENLKVFLGHLRFS